MPVTDKRIDAYIAEARPFAQPVLEHIRKLIHDSCPDVVETMKWRIPHFMYNEKILCAMAAFKAHCAFGFYLSSLMTDPHGVMQNRDDKTGMGAFGKIETIKDLPSSGVLREYIREAMMLIDQGAKKPGTGSSKKELVIPRDFRKLLNSNKVAAKHFNEFSYYNQKEYVEWITEAKTENTRNRRLATALEWIAEGKPRNWKYMKKTGVA